MRKIFTMDVPEGTAGTLGYELPLLRHLLDFDAKSLCKLLSSDPGGIGLLLDMEKRLYRPPLQGIAGKLWYELSLDDTLRAQRRVDGENAIQGGHAFDDTNRVQLLKILEAVMLYGKDRLEACEIDRLMPYMREIRPADRPAGVSSATGMLPPTWTHTSANDADAIVGVVMTPVSPNNSRKLLRNFYKLLADTRQNTRKNLGLEKVQRGLLGQSPAPGNWAEIHEVR